TAITAVRRRASSVAPGSGNAYASAASSAASASATNRRRAASMAPEYGGLGLLALLDLTHPALGREVARIEAERLAQVLLGRLVVGLVQRQLAEDAVRAARGARLLEHALGAGADVGGGESAGVASLGTEVLEPGLEQPVLGLVGHALDGEPELAQRARQGALAQQAQALVDGVLGGQARPPGAAPPRRRGELHAAPELCQRIEGAARRRRRSRDGRRGGGRGRRS